MHLPHNHPHEPQFVPPEKHHWKSEVGKSEKTHGSRLLCPIYRPIVIV